eukprot:CAMPEP_0183438250 /NCGR_PEP_ID=MMETSP0370-20130417/76902_1 /TAXON_ID=268820 /ORGANISM="Peridinium aciculiferum, Strain PAER-2" /LENGTH=40 /DNA_ID= /DNA_START= /DNA_END= /DNA_ORIENTATION=
MARAQTGTALEPLGAGELGGEWPRESLSDIEASEKKTDSR